MKAEKRKTGAFDDQKWSLGKDMEPTLRFKLHLKQPQQSIGLQDWLGGQVEMCSADIKKMDLILCPTYFVVLIQGFQAL